MDCQKAKESLRVIVSKLAAVRTTIQGSTNAPAEWLRMTIGKSHTPMFSWSNVAYCADPNTQCQ